MTIIKLFDNEREAIRSRDVYNHERGKRAVVAKLPDSDVVDMGGGPKQRIFSGSISPSTWMLVVED